MRTRQSVVFSVPFFYENYCCENKSLQRRTVAAAVVPRKFRINKSVDKLLSFNVPFPVSFIFVFKSELTVNNVQYKFCR